MSDVDETLAEALTRLMHDQRLGYAQIAKPGHLSRNTVRLIATGKTLHPGELTLIKICVGLAVHPHYRILDQEYLRMSLDTLGRASGHPDLGTEGIQRTLPVLLATIVGDLDAANAWVELIAEQAALTSDEVRALSAQLSHRSSDEDGPSGSSPV
jgi:hypothetical protein